MKCVRQYYTEYIGRAAYLSFMNGFVVLKMQSFAFCSAKHIQYNKATRIITLHINRNIFPIQTIIPTPV